ncbi:MAG: branched-chain amino acid ABC transporter permease [Desulfobacteraceae bacterium]|nr:branched-chain amino acid ABC transporter permease [Desulfobacteraceae bacterium]
MIAYLSFELIVQLVVNGILYGTIYGIAAIGLSLIFGTMRIIFLAQGTMIILFTYFGYWLLELAGIDPFVSLLIVVPLSMIIGVLLYRSLFKESAEMDDKNASLLLAVGIMFLVNNLMLVMWSANPRMANTAYTEVVFSPMGITIPFTRLIALGLAILSAGLLTLFLKKTYLGMAVRAASENMLYATLVGINPHRVNTVAFAIGIGLAGVAGIGVLQIVPFDPFFGFTFALKALIALALGGIGSVFGALMGGILLGLLESLGSFFVGGGWAEAVAFGAFLLVLMFRPEGLFVRSVKKA